MRNGNVVGSNDQVEGGSSSERKVNAFKRSRETAETGD